MGASDDAVSGRGGPTIWRTMAALIAGFVAGRIIKRSVAERRDERLRRQVAVAEQREDDQAAS